jgi:hypothetical protein
LAIGVWKVEAEGAAPSGKVHGEVWEFDKAVFWGKISGVGGVEAGAVKRRRKQQIMDWQSYYGIGPSGLAPGRGVRGSVWTPALQDWHQIRPIDLNLSVQAYDFSPVMANFHVFHPLSQL